MTTRFLCLCLLLITARPLRAQEPASLLRDIRQKLDKINDYQADARLKTNIPFLRVPDAAVQVFYKKPDHIRIKNEQGISLVPKESVSISLYSLVNGRYQIIDAGQEQLNGVPVRIIKLLPQDESSDLVLASLYIDPVQKLILKARITSRRNGTDEVDLSYGRYAAISLPDKIIFSFNTQDFKLPKGITFDYDDGKAGKTPPADGKNQRGKIELDFGGYRVNKGVGEEVFK